MGVCWCKDKGPEEGDVYALSTEPVAASPVAVEARQRHRKLVASKIVDQLVLEMLGLIASIVDNDEESPISLIKLHRIADKEEGWIQVVLSMVNVIPLDDPFGPSVITILLDDCALPSKDSVIKVTQMLGLSSERATARELNVRVERNICVVLGCLAEKLAGPNSVAVLTQHTLDYLIAFLVRRREACIVLFALLALEKFAHTTENKLTINKCLEREKENPLLVLERLAADHDSVWRQVGFCAKWALDNLFIVEGRKLSYEVVDMSSINVILNSNDVSEYLKISCNGLEARCDSYSFESVRCTFQEGYGIGDDLYSLSYDGCRKLIWYKARSEPVTEIPEWRPGDVLGCLIDLRSTKEEGSRRPRSQGRSDSSPNITLDESPTPDRVPATPATPASTPPCEVEEDPEDDQVFDLPAHELIASLGVQRGAA
ncbi:hypothetical protein MSG28_000912 [Choristoneura fumiferana]|uniref:Uncharacterized protein n=1 Tax=Choristoneura fumiferana TaxID=7141 RepID=A0ACC0K2V5_CHOFU|nr:hypothetical protein MSG28_000912 [Choristoneura fumiferana]